MIRMEKKNFKNIFATRDAPSAQNSFFPQRPESKTNPYAVPPRCPVNMPPLAIQPVHNSAPLPPSGSNSHRPIWSNGVVASQQQQQQQKQHQKAPPTAASNLGLEKLRNNLKADLLSAGSSHSCTSCEPSAMGHQPMAHSFCPTCRDYLCVQCDAAHRRVKATRGHELRILTPTRPHNVFDEPLNASPFANLTYFCQNHAEECGFWCSTCSRKCCQTCLRSDGYHRGHDVLPIAVPGSKEESRSQNTALPTRFQQEVNSMSTHAGLVCTKMQNCLEQLRIHNQTIRDNHVTASNQLKTHFDEIMLKFNCEKDQLLLKLEGIKEERLKHVNEKIDAIYNKQQQLKFYLQNSAPMTPTRVQEFKQVLLETQNFPFSQMPEISPNDVKIGFKPQMVPIAIGKIITAVSAAASYAIGLGGLTLSVF
jgi:hypothetical protein